MVALMHSEGWQLRAATVSRFTARSETLNPGQTERRRAVEAIQRVAGNDLCTLLRVLASVLPCSKLLSYTATCGLQL